MRSLPYVVSEEALADIDGIWQHTCEKWSVDQANRYYDLIFDEVENLSENPHSGKPVEDIRKGYRVSKVKSHLIFYKIVNETIEIIRVLHHRMDIESRLSD